jgi:hypothetical protein
MRVDVLTDYENDFLHFVFSEAISSPSTTHSHSDHEHDHDFELESNLSRTASLDTMSRNTSIDEDLFAHDHHDDDDFHHYSSSEVDHESSHSEHEAPMGPPHHKKYRQPASLRALNLTIGPTWVSI